MFKIILMLLMILCLNACNTIERGVICKEIDLYQIRPTVNFTVSFKKNYCLAKCFDFNSWKELPFKKCEDFKDVEPEYGKNYKLLPLVACDEITGFDLSDAAKNIRPNVKALYNVKKKLCK